MIIRTRFPGLPHLSAEATHYLDRALECERRAGLAMRDGRRDLYWLLHALARWAWDGYRGATAALTGTRAAAPRAAAWSPAPVGPTPSPTTHTKGAPPQHDTPLITDTIN